MNPFYHKRPEGITKTDILKADKDADLADVPDNICIHGLNNLEHAEDGDLSFFTTLLVSGNKYVEALKNTKASYVIVKKQHKDMVPTHIKTIISEEPYITFMRLCKMLNVEKVARGDSKIAASAQIGKLASIGECVEIGDNAVIEDFVRVGSGAKIGAGTVIKAGAVIGNNCQIGENCTIGTNASIQYTIMGDRCNIYAGAVIGQDGFGFAFDKRVMHNEKLDHFSFVQLGNDVEIGSNACIDRGMFLPTNIGNDVKLDNMVQIAHNVTVGDHTVMAAQTGVAGSTTIGYGCMIGGKVGIAGHIKIGNQCIVYASSNISKSFPDGSKIIGTPGEHYNQWVKSYAMIQGFIKRHGASKKGQKPKGLMSFLLRRK